MDESVAGSIWLRVLLLSRRFMPWRHKYGYVIIDNRFVSKQVPNAAKPVFNLARFGWWREIALSQYGQLRIVVWVY